MDGFNLEEELSEQFWDRPHRPEVAAEEDQDEIGGQVPSTRKLPEVWTRVFSVYGGDIGNVKAHPTSTDLMLLAGH